MSLWKQRGHNLNKCLQKSFGFSFFPIKTALMNANKKLGFGLFHVKFHTKYLFSCVFYYFYFLFFDDLCTSLKVKLKEYEDTWIISININMKPTTHFVHPRWRKFCQNYPNLKWDSNIVLLNILWFDHMSCEVLYDFEVRQRISSLSKKKYIYFIFFKLHFQNY